MLMLHVEAGPDSDGLDLLQFSLNFEVSVDLGLDDIQ